MGVTVQAQQFPHTSQPSTPALLASSKRINHGTLPIAMGPHATVPLGTILDLHEGAFAMHVSDWPQMCNGCREYKPLDTQMMVFARVLTLVLSLCCCIWKAALNSRSKTADDDGNRNLLNRNDAVPNRSEYSQGNICRVRPRRGDRITAGDADYHRHTWTRFTSHAWTHHKMLFLENPRPWREAQHDFPAVPKTSSFNGVPLVKIYSGDGNCQ